MNLPKRLFFTGVPGSRWSGIAQILESLSGFNTTDRTPERTYEHHSYTGHLGAYFGRGMEFPAELDLNMIDSAWTDPSVGTQIVKSHDWAYKLDQVYNTTRSTGDWVMLYTVQICQVKHGGTKQAVFRLNIQTMMCIKIIPECSQKL